MPSKEEEKKNTPHDALVKKVMENPVAAQEFLEEYLPVDFKEFLDLSTLQVEKESYVEDSLKKRLSDIVYSVTTRNSEKAFIYTLLEHQSECDYWISLRLWQYSLLLLERHKKDEEKLPLVLPLILYNGKKKYTAPKNLWELFNNPVLAKKAMGEDYQLIDLQSMSDDEIDYEKHLSFVLYTMKHIHDRDVLKMLERAMQRCTKALIIDKGKNYVHTKLILWYTDTKVSEDKKQLLEQLIVDNLPKEDTKDIMKTIADSYIEEGFNKGVEKTAKRMLQENTDIKFISSVTGLSTDEILKLKNKL